MKHGLFWCGLVLSGVAAVYFAYSLDPREVMAAFRAADPLWFLLGTLVFCLSVALRGPRWRHMVQDVCPADNATATGALLIGFLANRVLPARAGEVVRCLVLARRHDASVTGLLASVVVEKVIDLLAVAVCASVALVWWSSLHGGAEAADILLGRRTVWLVSGATALCALTLLALWPSRVVALAARAAAWLPAGLQRSVVRLSHACEDGLAALRDGRSLAFVAVYTAWIWFFLFLSELLTIKAFDSSVPPVAALVLTVAIAVGVSLPQAPSFIGVFWVITQHVLELFGMETQSAKAVALAMWFQQMVPVGVIGLLCLWHMEPHLRRATP